MVLYASDLNLTGYTLIEDTAVNSALNFADASNSLLTFANSPTSIINPYTIEFAVLRNQFYIYNFRRQINFDKKQQPAKCPHAINAYHVKHSLG